MSKEEIEESKQCLEEIIVNTYAEGKAIKLERLKNYIQQLETKVEELEEREEKVKEIIEPVQGLQCFDFNIALNILTKILNLYKEK